MMALCIGEAAPYFDIETTIGPINLYPLMGNSLAFLFRHSECYTPADWQPKVKVITPHSITNVNAKNLPPHGWEGLIPYLHLMKVN